MSKTEQKKSVAKTARSTVSISSRALQKLDKISEKYAIAKSAIITVLIEKYADKEYPSDNSTEE